MRRAVLLVALVCLAMATAAIAQESGGQPVINKQATAEFVTFPGLPDCLTGVVQHGDPNNGPSVILFKFDPACAVPWHWHTPNEHLMITGGSLVLQVKGESKPITLRSGDYALMPSRHVHQARCMGSVPCNLFVSADAAFDIHYVDSSGKEIPPAEALKGVNKVPASPPAAPKKKS